MNSSSKNIENTTAGKEQTIFRTSKS